MAYNYTCIGTRVELSDKKPSEPLVLFCCLFYHCVQIKLIEIIQSSSRAWERYAPLCRRRKDSQVRSVTMASRAVRCLMLCRTGRLRHHLVLSPRLSHSLSECFVTLSLSFSLPSVPVIMTTRPLRHIVIVTRFSFRSIVNFINASWHANFSRFFPRLVLSCFFFGQRWWVSCRTDPFHGPVRHLTHHLCSWWWSVIPWWWSVNSRCRSVTPPKSASNVVVVVSNVNIGGN